MNTFYPEIHHRRSIRLKEYDYSQPGAYFITINTHRKEPALGNIEDGVMSQNQFGKIAHSCWEEIPRHYLCVELILF